MLFKKNRKYRCQNLKTLRREAKIGIAHPCLPFIIFHLKNSILRILRHIKLYYRCTESSALKNFTNLLFCFFSLIHSKKKKKSDDGEVKELKHLLCKPFLHINSTLKNVLKTYILSSLCHT